MISVQKLSLHGANGEALPTSSEIPGGSPVSQSVSLVYITPIHIVTKHTVYGIATLMSKGPYTVCIVYIYALPWPPRALIDYALCLLALGH